MNTKKSVIGWKTPTKEEEFDLFCYDMYMAMKDEVYEWEKKMPTIQSTEYIEKNKTMLKQEFMKLKNKGKL